MSFSLTMVGDQSCDLFPRKVYNYLCDQVRFCKYQQCDETYYTVIQDGRPAGTNSYFWVHRTSEEGRGLFYPEISIRHLHPIPQRLLSSEAYSSYCSCQYSLSFFVISLMTLQGLPVATVWSGISFVTTQPDHFDPRKHSWSEIAQAMCQAEVVHEVIILFSFVPILFSIRFGAIVVFVITSAAAAAFDLIIVMMQRYNRSRSVKRIR